MPKPGDLFVSVMDFFAILLPGALVAGAATKLFGRYEWISPGLLTSDVAGWVLFAIAAYTFGHAAYAVTSNFDEWLYGPFRRWVWPYGKNKCFNLADEERRRFFAGVDTSAYDAPMTTFTWAKALLRLKAPAASAEVERYEADSKFFRSMMVVLPVCAFSELGMCGLVACMVLFGAMFWLYAERRHKSIEWACRYVVTLLHSQEIRATDADQRED